MYETLIFSSFCSHAWMDAFSLQNSSPMGHDYMLGFGSQNRASGSGIRLYLGFIYFASYLAQWAFVLGWGEDSP